MTKNKRKVDRREQRAGFALDQVLALGGINRIYKDKTAAIHSRFMPVEESWAT